MQVVALQAGYIDNILRQKNDQFEVSDNTEIKEGCWFYSIEPVIEAEAAPGAEPEAVVQRRARRGRR